MATVNGNLADGISTEIGLIGEGTRGRFVTWGGAVAYMGDAKETVYYKLRGYYVAGSTYEQWVTTDLNSSPPSGHTLTNTYVVQVWRAVG